MWRPRQGPTRRPRARRRGPRAGRTGRRLRRGHGWSRPRRQLTSSRVRHRSPLRVYRAPRASRTASRVWVEVGSADQRDRARALCSWHTMCVMPHLHHPTAQPVRGRPRVLPRSRCAVDHVRTATADVANDEGQRMADDHEAELQRMRTDWRPARSARAGAEPGPPAGGVAGSAPPAQPRPAARDGDPADGRRTGRGIEGREQEAAQARKPPGPRARTARTSQRTTPVERGGGPPTARTPRAAGWSGRDRGGRGRRRGAASRTASARPVAPP